MSAFELNKIVGAILGATLFALILGFVADLIFARHDSPETPVFLVGAPAEHTPDGEPADMADDAVAEGTTEAAGETARSDGVLALLADADIAAGEKAAKKCVACHSFDEGGAQKVGPNLWDIVDSDVAATEGFSYSTVLNELVGDWTYQALDGFLAAPKQFAKGTKMAFPGIKDPQDRANVIAYLRSFSASPAPLPEPTAAPQITETEAPTEPDSAPAEVAAVEAAQDTPEPTASPEPETSAETEAPATSEPATSERAASEPAASEPAAEGESGGVAVAVAAADIAAGEKVAKKCVACHSVDAAKSGKIGPALWDIVGRPIAAIEGFKYSKGLMEVGGDWTYDALDAFLAAPRDFAKGTKMAFPGIKDAGDRAAVIAYLRSLAEQPHPLP